MIGRRMTGAALLACALATAAGCQTRTAENVMRDFSPALSSSESSEVAFLRDEASARTADRAARVAAETGWRCEEKLRDFAMRESPRLWRAVLDLRGELSVRREGLDELRRDLREFGRDPDADVDYRRFVRQREEVGTALVKVFRALEEAFIAAKKLEVEPNHPEMERRVRAALESGTSEAERLARHYMAMREDKQ